MKPINKEIKDLTDKEKVRTDNEEKMNDECLAELFYLKSMVDVAL
jgi:hypothetical protein